MKSINIHLLDKTGDVQYGLNWGHRDNRDKNQSYLQLPSDVYKSDFFPKKGTYFLVYTDDGHSFAMNRAQKTDDGTAIQTPEDNSILGKYLRKRLGLTDGKEILVNDILSYGRTDISITKFDNRHYYLDFKKDWVSDNISYIYDTFLYLEYYNNGEKLPVDKIKEDLSYHSLKDAVTYKNGIFTLNNSNNSIPQSLVDFAKSDFLKKHYMNEIILQKIFYGAPGTGKSHTVDTEYVKGNKCFRITFHPDTDYASFVGCYKPKMGGPTGEDITYSFVPQVFLNAYIYAWNHPDEPTYLVIEELNRGNCAQIFGDIFQLLDRQKTVHPGYSKYTINADSDIATYLSGKLENKERYEKAICEIYGLKEFDFSILALPSNLNILATMNTSDQSLFPIDSAFKRRWEMGYVAVNYADAEQFSVKIDDAHKYSWADVLRGLNRYIKQEKHSTNKILGNRFVQADENNVISSVAFRDKVLFFLFNDVFKDEDEFRTSFFGGNDTLYFEDLCEGDDWTTYVINFVEKTCGASNKSNATQPDGVTPQQAEKESTTDTE
ncbi:MAG: NgoFVII family restriction endonuclease [Alistipes sp.]|jgi:hypothetical protein|nr:NgoFVII family restriction endonuclease [Alistipes sp.]